MTIYNSVRMGDYTEPLEESQEQSDLTPLPTLFDEAFQLYSSAVESEITPDEAKKGCDLLRNCEVLIDKLGIFSSNEQKDDISTADLKYLLVPYFMSVLLEKVKNSDRLKAVKEASMYIKMFISSCERLELVPDAELSTMNQEAPMTPEMRRATKIARFKISRAAESKLQEIKERKERRARSKAASAKESTVEHGEEFDDESEEREAFDLADMLKLEEELLNMKQNSENGQNGLSSEMLDERASRAEEFHRNAASKAKTAKAAQPITCATYAQDVIEGRAQISEGHHHHDRPLLFGPASVVQQPITSERQRIAAQVFQPSHRMPTMSIEQAGLKEMEIMTKWTERNARLQAEANSSWANENNKNNESDDEAAEYKARAWDDWKDENPRGSGNTKLTPCG